MGQSLFLLIFSVAAVLTSGLWISKSDRAPVDQPHSATSAVTDSIRPTQLPAAITTATAPRSIQGPVASKLEQYATQSASVPGAAAISTLETSIIKPVDVFRTSANENPSTHVNLVADIQRELQRVGCLKTDTAGVWSTVTQKAMGEFLGRVNATLPHDNPDHLLLTLVRGFPGMACRVTCPKGQTSGKDNQCLPNAVIAHAHKKPTSETNRKIALTPAIASKAQAAAQKVAVDSQNIPQAYTALQPDLPGRMALGVNDALSRPTSLSQQVPEATHNISPPRKTAAAAKRKNQVTSRRATGPLPIINRAIVQPQTIRTATAGTGPASSWTKEFFARRDTTSER